MWNARVVATGDKQNKQQWVSEHLATQQYPPPKQQNPTSRSPVLSQPGLDLGIDPCPHQGQMLWLHMAHGPFHLHTYLLIQSPRKPAPAQEVNLHLFHQHILMYFVWDCASQECCWSCIACSAPISKSPKMPISASTRIALLRSSPRAERKGDGASGGQLTLKRVRKEVLCTVLATFLWVDHCFNISVFISKMMIWISKNEKPLTKREIQEQSRGTPYMKAHLTEVTHIYKDFKQMINPLFILRISTLFQLPT